MYNQRGRRRNITWDREAVVNRQEEDTYGIDWDVEESNEEELEEGYEEVEDGVYLDGVRLNITSKDKKDKFMDTHVRYTTYLDSNLLRVLKIVCKEQNRKIATVINEAVKEYLITNSN